MLASASQLEQCNTQEIQQIDKDHFVHPWQIFDLFRKDGALPMARGEGCYIWDTDGNKYFDAVGGLWCNNIGLGRKDMAEAIAEQAYQLSYASAFTDITNAPAALLCQKLAELAPGDLNHVMLSTGGSTAVDSAYRLINFYQNCRGKKNKKHVISRINSYHGSTYIAMSIGGKPGDRSPLFNYESETIHHISCPNYYRGADAGMSESEYLQVLLTEFEDKIIELGGEDAVAAYFAEPVMGAGGVIVPPAGYNKRMWEICQKYDILYVSDEVVTAFGRLGHWFASKDLFDFEPDIITCAKGLTSGYLPLGATIFSDKIFDVIDEVDQGRCFTQGYTYSGHPVSCAAARKNIEIMEQENIFANVIEVGPYFKQQLETLLDLPIVGQVRGRGFMMCVEFVADKETRALFDESLDIGKRIANHADAKGLIVRPLVHLNVMSPPLIMTRQEVDFVVATLRECILDTIDELRREGHYDG
jgi:adenosylmethionine-8-amino-7-oxononanoate aminotransferase